MGLSRAHIEDGESIVGPIEGCLVFRGDVDCV